MKALFLAVVAAAMVAGSACAVCAQSANPASSYTWGWESGYITKDAEVVLRNSGGKFLVLPSLRTWHPVQIPEKGTCRVYKGQLILKMADLDGTTQVRLVTAATDEKDCPFGTVFHLSTAEYEAARAAFMAAQKGANDRLGIKR